MEPSSANRSTPTAFVAPALIFKSFTRRLVDLSNRITDIADEVVSNVPPLLSPVMLITSGYLFIRSPEVRAYVPVLIMSLPPPENLYAVSLAVARSLNGVNRITDLFCILFFSNCSL